MSTKIAQNNNQQLKEFREYLNNFMIPMLKNVGFRLSISCIGTKDKIIDSIVKNSTQNKVEQELFCMYLNEFTIPKLQIFCRYLQISHTGTKDKIIDKLIKGTSKTEIEKIMEKNKDNNKYLVECNGVNYETFHAFFANYEPGNGYCKRCKKYVKFISYDNPFYEQMSEIVMRNEFNIYLNNFTLYELQMICCFFKISKYGTCDEIKNKLIGKITKDKMENVIESNKDKKYFAQCHGIYNNNHHHYFFTCKQYNGSSWCYTCEIDCFIYTEDNLFYDYNIENKEFHTYLNKFAISELQMLCSYLNIPKCGIKDKIIDEIVNKTTKIELENIIEINNNKKFFVQCFNPKFEYHYFFTNDHVDELAYFCSKCNILCQTFTMTNLFYNEKKNKIIQQPIIQQPIIQQPIIQPTQITLNQTIPQPNTKKTKEKIPATLRNIVWNHYIGEDQKKGKCLCCSTEDISCANFHCGHIISEKNGGPLIVDNLRPICGHCNSSIGSKNMEEFMEQFGITKPKNWCGNTESETVIPNNISEDDIKHIVWIKYVCNQQNKKCFVCNDIELVKSTLEYDYLNLGNNSIENIRPTCVDCHRLVLDRGILPFFKLYGIVNREG